MMNDIEDTASASPRENKAGTDTEKSPGSKDESSRKRILIVDDVLVMRLRLRAQLEDSGYMVFEAEDGEKALALLENNPDIHLIVADVSMPVMDGIEFIRRIRKSAEFAAIPVIVCTPRGNFPSSARRNNSACRDFLSNPSRNPRSCR